MVYNILYFFCIIFLFINLYNSNLDNKTNLAYLYISILILILIYISLDKIPNIENFSVYDTTTNLLSINSSIEEEQVLNLDNLVSLKSYNDKYLSTETNGNLRWNNQLIGNYEEFIMTTLEDKIVCIKGNNDKYLSVRCDGHVSCDKETITDTEKFVLTMHNGYYSLLSYYKKYIGVDNDNNIRCNSDIITVNEKIDIIRKPKKVEISNSNTNKLNIDAHLKQVNYGDIIYLQCNALDNKFLTGGRGTSVIPADSRHNRPELPNDTLAILSDTAYSGSGLTGGNQLFVKKSVPDLTNINNNNWYHGCTDGYDQGFYVKYWTYPNINNFSNIKVEQLLNSDKTEIIRNKMINWDWKYSNIINLNQNNKVILEITCILKVDVSKKYIFNLEYNNAVKLNINNNLIIDEWSDSGTFLRYSNSNSVYRTKNSKEVYLKRGYYPLKIHYYENTGSAVLKLKWNLNNNFEFINTNNLILNKHNNSSCTKTIEVLHDHVLVGLYYNFNYETSQKVINLHGHNDDYKKFGSIPNIVLKKGIHNLDHPNIKLKSLDDLGKRLGSIKIIKLPKFRTVEKDYGGMNQQVFTTNEKGNLLEWIIRSEVGSDKRTDKDTKHGQPIKYNDIIYLQSNTLDNRYLSGGIIDTQQLPYSNNENETIATVGNHYDAKYLEWKIMSDLKSNNNDFVAKVNVRYNQPVYLQSVFITDRYLCGGRHGFVFDNVDDIHSNVYMTSNTEGINELSWIIRDKRGDGRRLANTNWPLWEHQPGIIGINNWKNMFTASSCKNYSPYSGNNRKSINSKSNDIYFGESCIDYNSDNISSSWKVIKSETGWTTGDGRCNNQFLVVNLGVEQYVDKAIMYPGSEGEVKFFSIKLAKKDGVFLDFGTRFETNFVNSWIKSNTEVYITNSVTKKPWMVSCILGSIRCPSTSIKIVEGNEITTKKLDSNRTNERFKLKTFSTLSNDIVAIQINNNGYIKAKSNRKDIGISILASDIELPVLWVEERFKLEYINGFMAIKTHYGTYLAMNSIHGEKKLVQKSIVTPDSECLFDFNKTNGTKVIKQYQFNIKSKFQYMKILPISSINKCSLKLDLIDLLILCILDNMIKNIYQRIKTSSCFNYKNGKISKYPMGETCSYGNYTGEKLERNSFGGWMQGSKDSSPFILIDTMKEQFIKGGIIYNRDDEDELKDDTCDSCSNYVKNFNVEIAGNNKVFRLHSKHQTKVTDTNEPFNEQIGKNGRYRFNIMKENVRYIKLILTKCNNNCSMRLDIF